MVTMPSVFLPAVAAWLPPPEQAAVASTAVAATTAAQNPLLVLIGLPLIVRVPWWAGGFRTRGCYRPGSCLRLVEPAGHALAVLGDERRLRDAAPFHDVRAARREAAARLVLRDVDRLGVVDVDVHEPAGPLEVGGV